MKPLLFHLYFLKIFIFKRVIYTFLIVLLTNTTLVLLSATGYRLTCFCTKYLSI